MKPYTLPGNAGTVILQGSEAQQAETQRIIEARHAFATNYCESKGWPTDAADLTIEQILEIRAQEGWKKP